MRARVLASSMLFCLAGAAHGQRAVEAVPYYQAAEMMRGMANAVVLPRAAAFENEAQALVQGITAMCDAREAAAKGLAHARSRWSAAVLSWERLATVPVGPIIERRSIRNIDFVPTRPVLIERAIAAQPSTAAAMERIGGPAKGFPALEWMLWTRPVAPASPGCSYAIEVARDIAREASVLHGEFKRWAGRFGDDAFTVAAWAEFVNQWIGAVERLRLREIERPMREARDTGRAAAFPRAAGGMTAQAWQQRWETLRLFARLPPSQQPPAPGEGLVTLDVALLARGQGGLAQRWRERIARTDTAMRGLKPGQPTRLEAAARELGATRRLAQEAVAPALDVRLGFSDADGD